MGKTNAPDYDEMEMESEADAVSILVGWAPPTVF
jgi:hypothetical protein